MNQARPNQIDLHTAWRLAVVSVMTLGFCSCQSLTKRTEDPRPPQSPRLALNPPERAPAKVVAPNPGREGNRIPPASTNPPSAVGGAVTPPEPAESWPATSHPPASHPATEDPAIPYAAECPHCRPGHAALPATAFGGGCWPDDFAIPPNGEYVCNGGDRDFQVRVKQDRSVVGLHAGDTVVSYDTLDGHRQIEPSNEVCLYAPRFAAVRKVYGIVSHEQHDRLAGVVLPIGAEQSSDLDQPTTVAQPLQPGRKHSIRGMQSFREKNRGVGIDNAQRPAVAEDQFLPFENLTIMRRGVFDNSEKSRLAERLEAAVTWSHTQGPQVMIDNETAVEATGQSGTQSVHTYELPHGKSRLRVVKIASTKDAKSGESIEFSLRFDNVGDQTIGNVTVIDRLHDRLEYIADTQRCSLPADFSTQDEEAGLPRVLRWEIKDPMKVGHGGVIRFSCRVR